MAIASGSGPLHVEGEVVATFARGFATLMFAQARAYWSELGDRERGVGKATRVKYRRQPTHPLAGDIDLDGFLRWNALKVATSVADPLTGHDNTVTRPDDMSRPGFGKTNARTSTTVLSRPVAQLDD